MSIKFRCQSCEKVLETKDERAGKSGKCPHCGKRITVPNPAAPKKKKRKPVKQDPWGVDDDDDKEGSEDYFAGSKPSKPKPKGVTCDVCGAKNAAKARQCKSCGESFGGGRKKRKSEDHYASIGEVLSVTKDIYVAEMGLTIGTVIIPLVIQAVVGFIGIFVATFIALAIGKMMDSAAVAGMTAVVLYIVFYLMMFALVAHLAGGQHYLLNKVVRGKRANIGDIFSGGQFFWRIIGNGFLLGLVLFVFLLIFGMVTAIVDIGPDALQVLAVIVGTSVEVLTTLVFWPLIYFIVDRDDRGIQPIFSCFSYLKNHWLATILTLVIIFAVMGLMPMASVFVMSLITKSGIMALMLALLFIIAAIFIVPFFFLMFAVIFCHATGRHTPV